jgi:hypothetical protein
MLVVALCLKNSDGSARNALKYLMRRRGFDRNAQVVQGMQRKR